MRVRRGKNGTYYTDGNIDNCDYNRLRCSIREAYMMSDNVYRAEMPYALNECWELSKELLFQLCSIILAIIVFPIRGLLYKYFSYRTLQKEYDQSYLDKLKEQQFAEDYYEELQD